MKRTCIYNAFIERQGTKKSRIRRNNPQMETAILAQESCERAERRLGKAWSQLRGCWVTDGDLQTSFSVTWEAGKGSPSWTWENGWKQVRQTRGMDGLYSMESIAWMAYPYQPKCLALPTCPHMLFTNYLHVQHSKYIIKPSQSIDIEKDFETEAVIFYSSP